SPSEPCADFLDTRLLYWNKFGTPPTVLSKYGNESSALWYWWSDPDAKAALSDAREKNLPLAPKPTTVKFDKRFTPGSEEKAKE
ncbi:MAG: hypothetical protein ACQERN_02040, partial [Thermodesulfobacteriota bacterium]